MARHTAFIVGGEPSLVYGNLKRKLADFGVDVGAHSPWGKIVEHVPKHCTCVLIIKDMIAHREDGTTAHLAKKENLPYARIPRKFSKAIPALLASGIIQPKPECIKQEVVTVTPTKTSTPRAVISDVVKEWAVLLIEEDPEKFLTRNPEGKLVASESGPSVMLPKLKEFLAGEGTNPMPGDSDLTTLCNESAAAVAADWNSFRVKNVNEKPHVEWVRFTRIREAWLRKKLSEMKSRGVSPQSVNSLKNLTKDVFGVALGDVNVKAILAGTATTHAPVVPEGFILLLNIGEYFKEKVRTLGLDMGASNSAIRQAVAAGKLKGHKFGTTASTPWYTRKEWVDDYLTKIAAARKAPPVMEEPTTKKPIVAVSTPLLIRLDSLAKLVERMSSDLDSMSLRVAKLEGLSKVSTGINTKESPDMLKALSILTDLGYEVSIRKARP